MTAFEYRPPRGVVPFRIPLSRRIMLTLGWLVLAAGAAAVAVEPFPRDVPPVVALGAGAIAALAIMLVLPEPKPITRKRQTRVTLADQRLDLMAAAERVPALESKPQLDAAYRSHPLAA